MILNSVEKALMNNPIRAYVQRNHEAVLLERLGGRVEGLRVLEVGCGRGIGTEIIFEQFGAREVHAYDLDPVMVELSRRRLQKYLPERLFLNVGDAEKIDEPSESFDAVFDFGIIHHIPNWRKALSEIRRVLKPGGRFFFEEVTRQALDRWLYRTFLKHPTRDRFDADEFVMELERLGISVGDRVGRWFFGDFIIGVGHRNETFLLKGGEGQLCLVKK